MKITRINKIKKYRIFHDFIWPSDLQDFGRFNLIYGWNGSGKTTLSSLFRHIETQQAITEGEANFQVDGNSISGTSLSGSLALSQVRVFNKDFVAANVFASPTSINPIFFFGEDSIEKQKQIEALKKQLSDEKVKTANKESEKSAAESSLDIFCVQQAKSIKELLSSSGQNIYNNYNKTNFKSACEALANGDAASKILNDEKKNALKRQKDGTLKEPVSTDLSFPNIDGLTQETEVLLGRTILSQVLDELVSDSGLAAWIREGLDYHTGGNTSSTCRFCGQTLPQDRITKLQGHFNDQYNRFLEEVQSKVADLQSKQKDISKISLPPRAALYDHLSDEYVKAVSALETHIAGIEAYLNALILALQQKQTKPFEALSLQPLLGSITPPDNKVSSEILSRINMLIEQHNVQTNDFQKMVNEARKLLEDCLVAEAIEEFKTKYKAVLDAARELQTLGLTVQRVKSQIEELEKLVIEHRRPADELNAELCSYLGRDELKFQVLNTGYAITRNGLAATDLSEGEKTAIAFLYFLKSLQDKAFDLKKGIVVIDDPVSSLDSNALFCAFGFMKERTKEVGQLFVLTHNSGFFRQVKNWFNHLPGQKKSDPSKHPARFFMLSNVVENGQRNSLLCKLDPLLYQFESEYHYLFKIVHEEANREPGDWALEQFYGLPNIARRLLESFLAFRYPSQTGELWQQLNNVSFDPVKKSRILRFLHTYSHEGKISDPEHDMSILAETPQVLKNLLELLESEDPKHFGEMENLVKPPKIGD